MRGGRIVAVVASAFAILAVPPVSHAAAPPNPQDPCSKAGRDTCGTLGIGFYKRYGYGLRWFGDYRGAVAGGAHAFCIDLGYWYASRRYRYQQQMDQVLRNQAGERVPLERQQELSYAISRYGGSSRPHQQAAVMLYVHSRMGDARPGELDPAAISPAVASLYHRIDRDARRLHGPYRIETSLPGSLTVDRAATATIRVVSARRHPVPHVRLSLTAQGASGLPTTLETNAAGVARAEFTPTAASGLQLRLATEPLAGSRPRVFAPTAAGAAANGQRLAVASSQHVVATVSRADVHAVPQLAAHVSATLMRPGTRIADIVSVSGLGGATARVHVELWGPFASRRGIRCTGVPTWTGIFVVRGDSTTTTDRVMLRRSGFYTYREHLLGSTSVADTMTPCAVEAGTALAAPRIVTGRGDLAAPALTKGDGPPTPVRLRLPALGIDAPVSPAAIDLAHGVLGVPAGIHRIGWWRDGMAPGASSGSILLAGHVDSASAGRGALFALAEASRGELIRIGTAAGRTYTYRIVSIRSYPKAALPLQVYSRTGHTRLVLVTCGGPFDAATGHYRDNIVVVALPTR